ncbi:Inosine-5'-monophosphate dehydrogenase [Fundidesulfovibrio magnetotacticus]|uniref:Inosine-5'-monophosphate dehydrogenase n=1 Tax=Fundidesulfovibrio magnetotacticus TaxID=2730080 RepID=A0A6V8LRV1_9BACT|nr:CBS domain-containing protein [Fundidesulfovibrio magnetotacticus]GFK93281.1 Inosine-5'-monophosphate dehydrogenase [Fundidesulfovibrio magnetotacticus]
MYVGLKMLKDFHPVTPATPLSEARKILEKEEYWMLLVTEGERLAGYVRHEDLAAALPSLVSTLERHEANYLISKLTVGMVMRRDITTVPPEMEIEQAAQIMHDKNLAGLGVVDEKGRLVGYINRTVMLEVLVEEMGLALGGSRLVFEVEDRAGVILDAAGVIAAHGASILSTSTFFHNGRRMVILRVNALDDAPIRADLEAKGYRLESAADFRREWAEGA